MRACLICWHRVEEEVGGNVPGRSGLVKCQCSFQSWGRRVVAWPGTCVPRAYTAVKAWDTELMGEGSTGRAAVSLHRAWSSSSTLDGTHHQKVWWPRSKTGEVCCQDWVTRESTHHPAVPAGCHSLRIPPGKSLPDDLTPRFLCLIAELREECKCFVDHRVEFHPD